MAEEWEMALKRRLKNNSMSKKYHILYVDDEQRNLRILQASFKKKYHIHTAQSGPEALEILEEEDIQLLITDQKMPQMTGVELLEIVSERFPDVMKLILTGYSDVEDIIRALNKCGIFRYLMKPWQKEEMGNTLDKALENYQLRQDRKSLLKELKQANEQLEGRIEARTQELSQANDKLTQEIEERKIIERHLVQAKERAEEGSKAKQLFLSTMSHEIRTPLNAVIGMAHLLQDSNLDEAQRENLGVLLFSAKGLLTLINDILDFSRIEAGKLEIESVPFNFPELMRNISNTHRLKAEEMKLNYLVSVDPNIPEKLVGDQTRLSQILNNLLGNALKFTSKGEVQVLAQQIQATENSTIHIRFTVKDSGIGISKEKLEPIFEQFSQASSETTRKYGGSGLGLAIAKRLVELQGGSIKVESEVDKGTTFYVELPFRIPNQEDIRQAEKPESGRKPQEEQELLKSLNILLVEDNRINQILMKKFFSRWNTQYTLAVNGKDAFEKVQEQHFDLVLMDIQMPEMDGYAASKAIRGLPQPHYQKVPIIALTASTLQGEQLRAEKAGMDDYIVKPFDPEVLAQKILQHTRGEGNSQLSSSGSSGDDSCPTADLSNFREVMEGDEEGYRELIRATLQDLNELIDAVSGFVENRDSEALMVSTHNMKPPMQLMGLSELAEELTSLRETQEEAQIPEAAQQIQTRLHTLQKQLQKEC